MEDLQKNVVEINIPSISSLIKCPWLYFLIKFNVKNFLLYGLSLLFGPGECDYPKDEFRCLNQEKPY